MSSRSRWLIVLVSLPFVLLVALGGLLGATATPAQQAFAPIRLFENVVDLVVAGYVEPVDVNRIMDGAMRGLADGLDPASAYLTPAEMQVFTSDTPLPPGEVGLVVTRQFYLRIVGVRDGSPAARAGLRTGDFIRMIDRTATRDLSALAGTRLLRGAPGSTVSLLVIRGNPADPHDVTLTREVLKADRVATKRLPGGETYVRIASFGVGAAAELGKRLDGLGSAAAGGVVIDLRGTADGPVTEGIAAARLFIKTGTVATRAGRGPERDTATAAAGDGAITAPVVLLVSQGTANAAEVFAAALQGSGRAALVGEPTAGLAAVQELVRLPDGHGLWMTHARYLAADGAPIHENGLRPDVPVAEPAVEFGDAPPPGDGALDRAVARLRGGVAPAGG